MHTSFASQHEPRQSPSIFNISFIHLYVNLPDFIYTSHYLNILCFFCSLENILSPGIQKYQNPFFRLVPRELLSYNEASHQGFYIQLPPFFAPVFIFHASLRFNSASFHQCSYDFLTCSFIHVLVLLIILVGSLSNFPLFFLRVQSPCSSHTLVLSHFHSNWFSILFPAILYLLFCRAPVSMSSEPACVYCFTTNSLCGMFFFAFVFVGFSYVPVPFNFFTALFSVITMCTISFRYHTCFPFFTSS